MQDNYKRTALQRAALYGEMEVIDALIKKKAKMNLSDKVGIYKEELRLKQILLIFSLEIQPYIGLAAVEIPKPS